MLVTKTITNRVKGVLSLIINETQNVFVPRRMIIDNAFVAFETFHAIKNRKLGRQDFFALKLYISKMYNRLKRIFLDRIIYRMSFSNK